MLFSDETVAAACSIGFECAWESVRPVPRVDIDFGNGTRLTRTLNGNIATYFCTPDGRVLDVVPGLVGKAEFLRRLREATELYRLARERGEEVVRDHHARLAAAIASPESTAPVRPISRADLSKIAVESRVKHELRELVPAQPTTDGAADSVAADTDYNRAHRYAKVHALLAGAPLPAPSRITKSIYKDVLGVDLDDPFLGLAPYVLGGEVGRSAGGTAVR